MTTATFRSLRTGVKAAAQLAYAALLTLRQASRRPARDSVRNNVPDAYQAISEQYDGISALWDASAGSGAIRRLRCLARQHVQPGTAILDVGTGTGRCVRLLLEETQPRQIVGLDLSAAMLGKAGQSFGDPRVVFVQADAGRLPFPDDTFDAVTSLWALEVVRNPATVVRELLRVVRPEGIILTAFSSQPSHFLGRLAVRLFEPSLRSVFGAHFLAIDEQPLYACTMPCFHRYPGVVATVATYGKRCQNSQAWHTRPDLTPRP